MPVLTNYFGSDLTKQQYWMLELNRVHELHRQDEAGLLSSRWFDYRMMSPAQATYLFAAHYAHEYLETYKRIRDIRTVESVSPFAPEDIFASKELTPMWLARQEADRLGVKYDFFLHYAFDRFADRGWKAMPRPNQLYGEELLLDIRDAWQRRCREVLQLAENPFFFEIAYVAHPDQDRYYAWVVEQIKMREHKHMALARVLKDKILPRELAGQEFGIDTLKRALLFAATS